jgi:hypothetical protein
MPGGVVLRLASCVTEGKARELQLSGFYSGSFRVSGYGCESCAARQANE